MHRSGTSALTGALHLLGVPLGEPLMPANFANERGYWEHAEVVALHDRVLGAFGLSAADPAPLPAGWSESAVARDARGELEALLERRFGGFPLWAVKDPRLSVLLPLWKAPLERLGIEARAVVVLRSPWEVARSLAERDRTPRNRSLAAWGRFVADSERHTRGLGRCFVAFDRLLADPAGELGRLGQALGLVWPIQPAAALEEVRGFLEPSLRHWREDDTPSSLRTAAEVAAADAWETAQRLARRDERPGDAATFQEALAPLVRLADAQRPPRLIVLAVPPGVAPERAGEVAGLFQEGTEPGRVALRFVVPSDGEVARHLARLGDVVVRAGGEIEPSLRERATAFLRLEEDASAARRSAHDAAGVEVGPLPDGAFRVEWLACDAPRTVRPLDAFEARVALRNASSHRWPCLAEAGAERNGAMAVRLSHRLWTAGRAAVVCDDRTRVDLPWSLGPGDVVHLRVPVLPPRATGEYLLQIDLLQELVSWFESRGAARLELPLVVER